MPRLLCLLSPGMAEAAPAPPQVSIRPLILVLGVCGFASTFTMRLVDPIVPTLAGEYGRSIPQIAMIATAFSFSYALGQPFLGPIADSAGKVRTIVVCLMLLGLFSVLSAFAPSFELLTLARSITGVVAGGIIPVAMAAIGDRAPVAGRQAALGHFMVLTLVGQMSGAACSGFVADYLGWRSVFFMAAMLALLAALLAQVALKPRPDAQRKPLSLKGALAGYGVVFSNPRSRLLYGLVVLEGSLVFGLPPYVAAILAQRSGVGASEAGLAIAGMGLGGLIYGLATAQLVGWLGQRRMMIAGGLCMAAAMLIFTLPLPWWTAIALFILQGFGFFLLHGTYQALATELSPSVRGSAMALFACSLFLGHAIGPLVVGFGLSVIGMPATLVCLAVGTALVGYVSGNVLKVEDQRPR